MLLDNWTAQHYMYFLILFVVMFLKLIYIPSFQQLPFFLYNYLN